MQSNDITDTRADRTAKNDPVLTTATGSLCQRWYDAYELTNHGTTTSLYFTDDPRPEPRWVEISSLTGLPVTSIERAAGAYRRIGLAYDRWTLMSRETAPYESTVDRVVLASAERAWLRSKRRKG
jgi:hypothetical protein